MGALLSLLTSPPHSARRMVMICLSLSFLGVSRRRASPVPRDKTVRPTGGTVRLIFFHHFYGLFLEEASPETVIHSHPRSSEETCKDWKSKDKVL